MVPNVLLRVISHLVGNLVPLSCKLQVKMTVTLEPNFDSHRPFLNKLIMKNERILS